VLTTSWTCRWPWGLSTTQGTLHGLDRNWWKAHSISLFWDGSTGWITVDIRPSYQNAVILAQHREEPPLRRVYDSRYDFLQEAVHALEADRRLVLG
jgi:hypothetical protein